MAQPYLAELQSIIERLYDIDPDIGPIECKHFFSGAAAYINGLIFMSISPVGTSLKLSKPDCEHLFSQGATPLRYFPSAPIKAGYAVLPTTPMFDLSEQLSWIKRSAQFVEGD